MTNKDIYLIEELKKEIQDTVNKYIENGIPSYIQFTVFTDAVRSLSDYANADVKQAYEEAHNEDDNISETNNDEIISEIIKANSETNETDDEDEFPTLPEVSE